MISVLKYMEMDEVFKNLPLAEQKKMLDYLAKLPDVRFLSSEEREKYDESIKAIDDYYSGLYGSYVEGVEKGQAEGMEKGMNKRSLEIARKMLANGMDAATVMEITGLSESQLQQLKG